MPSTFKRTLKTSLVMHFVVITVFLVLPVVTRCIKCEKPDEDVVYFDLMPQPSEPAPPVPQSVPEPPRPETPQPEPPKPEPPQPEPLKPEPLPPEPKKPEPTPVAEKKKKPEVQRQTNIVYKTPQKPAPVKQSTIDPKSIEKSLFENLPAPPRMQASGGNPSEMARYDALVRNAYYRAWVQPSMRYPSVILRITIARDGRIVNKRMVSGSGIAEMDQSARSAMMAVTAVEPLPASFKGNLYEKEIELGFE